MSEDNSEPVNSGLTLVKRSLARWENEGGAAPSGHPASARGKGFRPVTGSPLFRIPTRGKLKRKPDGG
jgi:hypothetical protein